MRRVNVKLIISQHTAHLISCGVQWSQVILESSTENRTRRQGRRNPANTTMSIIVVLFLQRWKKKKERNQNNRLYHKTLAKFCHFQSGVSALVPTACAPGSVSPIEGLREKTGLVRRRSCLGKFPKAAPWEKGCKGEGVIWTGIKPNWESLQPFN